MAKPIDLTPYIAKVKPLEPKAFAWMTTGPTRDIHGVWPGDDDPVARLEHAARTKEPLSVLINLGQNACYRALVEVAKSAGGYNCTPLEPLSREEGTVAGINTEDE